MAITTSSTLNGVARVGLWVPPKKTKKKAKTAKAKGKKK